MTNRKPITALALDINGLVFHHAENYNGKRVVVCRFNDNCGAHIDADGIAALRDFCDASAALLAEDEPDGGPTT